MLEQPQQTRAVLTSVASFDHQVTGVTVAEVLDDGALRPYPDEAWNGWRNAKKNEVSPGDHWVCVQSVADGRGNVWVLDPAAPATSHLVPGGAKLVCTAPDGDRVAQTIPFDVPETTQAPAVEADTAALKRIPASTTTKERGTR